MNFNEYYQQYLLKHQNKWCRRLHILGQLMTILYIVFVFWLMFSFSLWFFPLFIFTPFIIYFFAWPSHFIFEKNTPAAFKNPWLAKLSDWRMMWDILRGRIPF